MTYRWLALGAACGVLAASAAGCGSTEDPMRPVPKAMVEMRDDGYHPKRVEIPVGGRITWVNMSVGESHTAQSEGVPEVVHDLRVLDAQNRFDTHTLISGEAHSVEFDTPGRYEYFSSFDPQFEGVVEVVRDR